MEQAVLKALKLVSPLQNLRASRVWDEQGVGRCASSVRCGAQRLADLHLQLPRCLR